MTTKQKVLKIAEELGVEVEYGGSGKQFEVQLVCPSGLRFEPGRHSAVNSVWDDMTSADCWRGALDDLKAGVEVCDDPECEWCHEDETI